METEVVEEVVVVVVVVEVVVVVRGALGSVRGNVSGTVVVVAVALEQAEEVEQVQTNDELQSRHVFSSEHIDAAVANTGAEPVNALDDAFRLVNGSLSNTSSDPLNLLFANSKVRNDVACASDDGKGPASKLFETSRWLSWVRSSRTRGPTSWLSLRILRLFSQHNSARHTWRTAFASW